MRNLEKVHCFSTIKKITIPYTFWVRLFSLPALPFTLWIKRWISKIKTAKKSIKLLTTKTFRNKIWKLKPSWKSEKILNYKIKIKNLYNRIPSKTFGIKKVTNQEQLSSIINHKFQFKTWWYKTSKIKKRVKTSFLLLNNPVLLMCQKNIPKTIFSIWKSWKAKNGEKITISVNNISLPCRPNVWPLHSKLYKDKDRLTSN